jgi:YD repeat-containing protein
MQSALNNMSLTTPNGLTSILNTTRSVILPDKNDPFSMTSMVDVVILNGRPFTSVYDATLLKFTDTTPEGRRSTSFTDSQGRILKEQVSGLNDTEFFYDARGRLTDVAQGPAGPGQRLSTIAYDGKGFVASVTDPLNRAVQFQYDLAGRVTKQTLPDLREINFTYDTNGNVSSITPPGRPAHGFHYTAVDLESEYSPPAIGLPEHRTFFAYNIDKQLTTITRPDAKTVTFNYEPGGRIASFVIPRGATSFAYSAITGNVTSITAPDAGGQSFTYDGSLLLSTTWAGSVAGSVARSYDNDFRIITRSVNGSNAIGFAYDNDSLLTGAGSETLSYDPTNGLLTGTTQGVVADSYGYNSFAEVASYDTTVSATSVFNTTFTRDKLGRITQKVETSQGVNNTFDYFYDFSGRLIAVNKNGVLNEAFTYDSNGNRTNNGAIYDDQDRLTTTNTANYTYTAKGNMIYFILVCFLDILILFFSINYFLRIQDRWKRKYAETPSGLNLFKGFLQPTIFSILIIVPSVLVPNFYIHFSKLDIHELWSVIPFSFILIYCLIYKSDEVSKVYSKIDKRKLDE